MKRRKPRLLSLLAIERGGWRHPWHTRCRWSADRERWEADIFPGLVNALDPFVTLPWDEAPEATRARLEQTSSVDAWLSERPLLPLASFRSIGGDAGPLGVGEGGTLSYEGVPEFFQARGVPPPVQVSTGAEGVSTAIQGLLDAGEGARLLRACELVLYLDRQATRTQWTTGAGVDGTFAQFEVTTFQRPGASERGRIQARSNWTPPRAGSDRDLLAGDWEESPVDELRLATVYFLSVPDAPVGSVPDGNWAPFVQYERWWNFHHAVNRLEPPLGRVDLRLQTGLAGGVGDAVNQFILAQVNDANSAAAQFLGRERLESRTWST